MKKTPGGAVVALQVLDRAREDLLGRAGRDLPRLSISGWVADSPISPRIETSTISAGKIDSTP